MHVSRSSLVVADFLPRDNSVKADPNHKRTFQRFPGNVAGDARSSEPPPRKTSIHVTHPKLPQD